MSLTRAEERRRIRDSRKRWAKRILWLIAVAVVASTFGTWLWEWTGTPQYFE